MTTILVIEDDDDIRDDIIGMLHLEGYQTIEAANGVDALKIAMMSPPDLILCDVVMPRIDGYEVLLQIRLNPRTWLTPFVFLTAKSDREDWRKGMNLGADDYLIKPFNYQELISTVQARLDKQNLIDTDRQAEAKSLQSIVLTALPQEFQIPLTIISEHVALLRQMQESSIDSTQARILDSIDKAADRLQHLAQNYLATMKLDLLQQDPNQINQLRRYELSTPSLFIKQTAHEVAHNFENTSELIIAIQDGRVHITSDHLRKLIFELVDNAYKFSYGNQPVRVSAAPSHKGYIIRVQNYGDGISTEQIAQLDQQLVFPISIEKRGKFGLGLVLCQQICRIYGGTLQIENSSNGQTTAYVVLPMTYQPS